MNLRRMIRHLFLALALVGCHPTPRPADPTGLDGGVADVASRPSDISATARQIISYAGWVLPAIDAVSAFLPITSELHAIIHDAIVAAEQLLPRLSTAVSVYQDRGGGTGQCDVYAVTGLVADALHAVADAVIRAGYTAPVDIKTILGSVEGIIDEAAPHCEDAALRRAGVEGRTRIERAEAAARQHGVDLRPFPPLHR